MTARARLAAAGLALLLAGGCSAATVDPELQRRIDEARERNTVAGMAIALLLSLAVRHAARGGSSWRARRRAARVAGEATPWSPGTGTVSRPTAPWLVAAALATEVATDIVILGTGALLGLVFGPVPAGGDPVEGFAVVLLAVFLLPIAAAVAAVAILVQGLAARLGTAGLPTLVLLALVHGALAGWGVLRFAEDGADLLSGSALACGLVGFGGFVTEVVVRARRPRGRRA